MNEIIKDLYPVGMRLPSVNVTVSQMMIDMFAIISHDHNLLHTDSTFASNTMFNGIIAHGMLSAAFISAIFGRIDGAVYISQHLQFIKPVRPGDNVVARAHVSGYDPNPATVIFDTHCLVGTATVIIGTATIWFPEHQDISVVYSYV